MKFKTKQRLSASMMLALMISSNVSAYSKIELTKMFEEKVNTGNGNIKAANYLASEKIIINQASNPEKYELKRPLMRQEMAGIVRKLIGLNKKTKCDKIFKDLTSYKPNDWACLSVEVLVDAGYIAKNEKYRPEDTVSKAEALSFIIKALFKSEYKKTYNKNLVWEENAIKFAKEKGLLREDIGNYKSKASRGFIFSIVYYAKISQELKKSGENNEILEKMKELEKKVEKYKKDNDSQEKEKLKKEIEKLAKEIKELKKNNSNSSSSDDNSDTSTDSTVEDNNSNSSSSDDDTDTSTDSTVEENNNNSSSDDDTDTSTDSTVEENNNNSSSDDDTDTSTDSTVEENNSNSSSDDDTDTSTDSTVEENNSNSSSDDDTDTSTDSTVEENNSNPSSDNNSDTSTDTTAAEDNNVVKKCIKWNRVRINVNKLSGDLYDCKDIGSGVVDSWSCKKRECEEYENSYINNKNLAINDIYGI